MNRNRERVASPLLACSLPGRRPAMAAVAGGGAARQRWELENGVRDFTEAGADFNWVYDNAAQQEVMRAAPWKQVGCRSPPPLPVGDAGPGRRRAGRGADGSLLPLPPRLGHRTRGTSRRSRSAPSRC